MEEKIKKIEEILGSKFEDWTDETLASIMNNEEAIKAFSPEVVVHLLKTRKNEGISGTLIPIKYGFDVRAIKSKIEGHLVSRKEKGMTEEDYRKNILDLKKLDNPIFKIAVFLTEVASFSEDYDVSKEEKEISEAVDGVAKIISSLDMTRGFFVITEILDILFPLRELYFQRYKVDIIKGNENLKKIVEAVNSRAKEIFESMNSLEKDQEDNKK
jgi:hypothetical protein